MISNRSLRMAGLIFWSLVAVALQASAVHAEPQQGKELKVLFLGDDGHHQPRVRFSQIQPVLASGGVQLTYTDDVKDLNTKNLSHYDAVLLYANIATIEPEQENALLEYVNAGGGFVPIHCASFCFQNSETIIALIGGQFKSHKTGTFRTEITTPDHPIMQRFGGFESWDETYVHHKHNEKDRTVLEVRAEGESKEPWTWVRTHGKGRVFYTAWGHDHRTWGNPGFANLLERGIRWSAGQDSAIVPPFQQDKPFVVPAMKKLAKDLKPFEYIDAGGKIPNYTPGKSWGTQGEELTKMQKPLPAEESLKHIVVPEGFRVELFASEPDIGGKPICMAWDERGRLWIAETYDYPNELQPVGEGRDRIRILEDTDGDWRADKFTVFAEKLSIPTGITFYKGGVIVHDGTRTLYLKDKDGDDVADERRELFTGWNQRDTHGGVSNFQYGLDNWIWAMQGYNQSQPKSEELSEESQSFRQGFFRFRPDGSEVEFIRSTDNNTWGLGISEEGIIFGSTANHNPSVYMPIPNRYYERVRGWTSSLVLGTIADTHLFNPITKNIRQVDHHGGYTAAAGHALYTARQYPQQYWNRTAFVNGPTGHLVGTFLLKQDGSDFASSSPFNLFASNDEWTAPIMAEVGPDGTVWVIDWYNYIVQHNPTPRGFKTGKGNAYETEIRDKKHGRIYRVIYDDGNKLKPMTLADASPQKLVATLSHPTMLWRKHAQRLLVERGQTDIVPELLKLIRDKTVDEIGLNVGAIHALWTLHGLGQLDGENETATAAVYAALAHPSAGVRRNAVQVLPASKESTAAILAANLLHDADGQVRLVATLALADLPPTPAAGKAVLDVVAAIEINPDRWISDAVTAAAANNAPAFLEAVANSAEAPTSDTLNTVKIVASHYSRSGPVETIGSLLKSLPSANDEVATAIVGGVATGWPKDKTPSTDADLDKAFVELVTKLPADGRGQVIKLAQSWGSKAFADYADRLMKNLLADLDNEENSQDQRIEAAAQLVKFQPRDAAVIKQMFKRITPQTPPGLALGMLQALKESEAKELGESITDRFGELTPALRAEGIRLLLNRPESTQALLAGVESGDILLSELALNQQQALASHPDKDIRERAEELFRRGGALPSADRQAVLDQMLSATQQKGNVAKGKAIFTKNCANCHQHSGEGRKIGPDLTGMVVHPKAELLTHILDPNRDVESNYRVYTVLTIDGITVNGLLASESKTAVEMIDVEGKKHALLRDDIDLLKASRKSLMPEGFEKQIPLEDMTDLLEFLTHRGKYVPISLAKAATIASDQGMFVTKEEEISRLIFDDWTPKLFKGVPFVLVDPQGGKVPNVIELYGPGGQVSRTMPKTASVAVNGPARAIHLLSGVSGWGHPYGEQKSVSMIVRLHYADGEQEDHSLLNGVHFADYIRRVDVPGSEFAFSLRNQQVRYLAILPKRTDPIETIEFVKGPDDSAPVVMAVTVESPDSGSDLEDGLDKAPDEATNEK